MQDCQAIARIMHAYLDGELSAKETVDVQTHLDNCPECAVLYRNEKLFLGLVQESLPATVAPRHLEQKVKMALKTSGAGERSRKYLRLVAIPALTMAVLVLVAAAFFSQAKAYLNEDLFRQEDISVAYMDYSGYREYQQLYPPFQWQVSIIDLIFNEGSNAAKYMKSF